MKNKINNIKNKIRAYFIKILRIDQIEIELKNHKKEVNAQLSNYYFKVNKNSKELNDAFIMINSLHDTISSVVSIGSDIEPYGKGRSWAVVCIEGNYNVVKFFDLSHKDGRDMLKVLKAFEGGRYVHDTPHGFFPRDVFIDW